MKFNIRQEKVLNATEPKILCLAGAAAGKTRVLTERIRRLIEEREVSPRDIVAITFTNMAADEMKRRLGAIANDMFIGTIHSYGNKICISNNIKTQQYLDSFEFDKILKKAITIPSERYPHVKHLLIDECQDLSPLEYAFLEKIPTENIFFVGDNRQCQPAGTKIKLRNGIIKNIEDIEVGDSVVWYDNNKSYLSSINISHNSIEKKVLKTASRAFCNDNLITVETDEHKTKYTPNHITYVRIHESEYNHAVYLMCDENNRFRIGKIPFICTNKAHTNPWREKLYAENCQKIWILKIFKTDHEARLLEAKLSYKYSIPQTCFQLNKVSWTKEDLDYIYDGLDTLTEAKKCLKEFNRDYNYPLLDRNTEESLHIHFARNAVTEIYAANLMSEVMDVLVYNNTLKHKKKYEQIKKITYEYISTPIQVYSLEVEGGTYVADEIVTHNCIYGFKGSTDEYLVSMYEDEAYKKYYLVENYRNAQDILNFADSLIASFIQLSPKSIPVKTKRGEVIKESFYEALEELEYTGNWGSWFILTRTNAELAQVQEMLDQKKIPNITFKKGDLDLTELDQLMQSDRVKVLTIHSAKGLENKNVIVVGARTYNEEERKIAYVGATRAENRLYWCPAVSRRVRGRRKDSTTTGHIKTDMIEF